ncbi:uncharacterized protein LOC121640743 [Melanotaenia boesemani]|uniref:uncharacterized protein LOC121640743 n=1 Tax=Melanotaenia boesemani TaxID=1250792 RepID=UPI001C0407A7|nr:uncharacterized protein LOC121640743 [Melanotaenia boesemani]XP_041842530.1 uncharacterized protein LOC121640743 [Melanotaenia boesemani]
MEEEVQQLRELMVQLKADNERLRREQAALQVGASGASSPSASDAPAVSVGPVTERLVVIPRDRRCPMFNGKTGMGIAEWIEEMQACVRARHLAAADQALFIFDHLEGEAKEEIKFRSSGERSDPVQVLDILKELYGCTESYVTLQQAFFSRHQQEGETLQEFSLALMALMDRVKQSAPDGVPNAGVWLRDQFIEHVYDSSLRRELKQLVRQQPRATMLELRSEAIRWEREGLPGGGRPRSCSLPSAYGLQYAVQGRLQPARRSSPSEPTLSELMDVLKQQQEQLNQLAQTVASLQAPRPREQVPRHGSLICHRCQQPGHFARECENERAFPRRQGNSVAGLNPSTAPFSRPSNQSEN